MCCTSPARVDVYTPPPTPLYSNVAHTGNGTWPRPLTGRRRGRDRKRLNRKLGCDPLRGAKVGERPRRLAAANRRQPDPAHPPNAREERRPVRVFVTQPKKNSANKRQARNTSAETGKRCKVSVRWGENVTLICAFLYV